MSCSVTGYGDTLLNPHSSVTVTLYSIPIRDSIGASSLHFVDDTNRCAVQEWGYDEMPLTVTAEPPYLLRRRRESYGKPPSQGVGGLAELVKLGPIIGSAFSYVDMATPSQC